MNKIHFIGIGGAGLSALARIMQARGWQVSGSDRGASTRTAALVEEGITVYIGHQAEQVNGVDVVVASSAIPKENPEIRAARALGLPVLKRNDWLPEMTKGFQVVAISGTHGKTTTTSMISLLLAEAGLDPTVVVGGEVPALGGNARAGKSSLFVVEADEYDHAFLGLHPYIGVVLNVEHDHPDIFPTEEDVENAFRRFLNQTTPLGSIVACIDDQGVQRVIGSLKTQASIMTYGWQDDADWQAIAWRRNEEGGSDFTALHQGKPFGDFTLALPGEHIVLNALAAIAVAQQFGVTATQIQSTLSDFKGAARRFDLVGEVDQIKIYDDYAHHPTEIRASLAATRQKFPDTPLWIVFQPHTFSRLGTFKEAFASAFDVADHVVVSDVYAAREQGDGAEQARSLTQAIKGTTATYRANQEEILTYLRQQMPERCIVMTMGAGNITTFGPRLLKALVSYERIVASVETPRRGVSTEATG